MAYARDLTDGEWAALSPGLADILHRYGVRPRIVPRAAAPARIAALWRGRTPVLTLGPRIYWPDAPPDFSLAGQERRMAVLQHELQHVLEYASGVLGVVRYLLWPPNWRYGYDLASAVWERLGAEQRASVVEHLWLAERGLAALDVDRLRALTPWARLDGDKS